MKDEQEKTKRRQVNILLDEKDVEKLDILAREAGYLTRSSMLRLLLQQAWKSYLKSRKNNESSL